MHVEVKHPLIGHKLTLVRDKTTGVKLFRRRGRWYAYHFVSVDM